MRREVLPFVFVSLIAGCSLSSSGGSDVAVALGAGPDQIAARRGDVSEAVDGLIVGHRLMAAGEYELALRAYYRASAERGVNVDILSAIGSANLRLGRVQQAEQVLRRALEQDETFVAAHNNLGVALGEQGKWGEAGLHFRNAFAFDGGRSSEIRDNLRLAIEKTKETGYDEREAHQLSLVRRGQGRFLLLETPL
ncbi:MAG: tetratricopeptide repeat protein [Rhodobacteraceae bacterium]|nr:tetratricopeptide repeat protein [Paracoccaceae bacterium]